jgi:hypothetical protein
MHRGRDTVTTSQSEQLFASDQRVWLEPVLGQGYQLWQLLSHTLHLAVHRRATPGRTVATQNKPRTCEQIIPFLKFIRQHQSPSSMEYNLVRNRNSRAMSEFQAYNITTADVSPDNSFTGLVGN